MYCWLNSWRVSTGSAPGEWIGVCGIWQTFELTFLYRLGIEYAPSILNDVEGCNPPSLPPGLPGPDVYLRKNGFPQQLVRLYEVTKNVGKFHIVVFTGDVHSTRERLKSLRNQIDKLSPPFAHAVSFRTIVLGHGIAFGEYLGVEQFGNAYWDPDHSAHQKYKTSPESGQIVVLRPDGIVGFISTLDGFDRVAEYLGRLIVPRKVEKTVTSGVNGDVGEIINLDENNLYYQQAKAQAKQQGLPVSTESGVVSAS